MEIIIIVLIAVEAALAIIREYHDVAELVRSLFRTADDPDVTSLTETLETDQPQFATSADRARSDERTERLHWTEGKRLV